VARRWGQKAISSNLIFLILAVLGVAIPSRASIKTLLTIPANAWKAGYEEKMRSSSRDKELKKKLKKKILGKKKDGVQDESNNAKSSL
jgi:hypothetical protein